MWNTRWESNFGLVVPNIIIYILEVFLDSLVMIEDAAPIWHKVMIELATTISEGIFF